MQIITGIHNRYYRHCEDFLSEAISIMAQNTKIVQSFAMTEAIFRTAFIRIFPAALLWVMCTLNCFSQVAEDDFVLINKAYSNANRISMKMKYEVYKNKESKIVYQLENGEIKRNGNAIYTRIGEIETIQNDKYTLIVDHEDKNISLLGNKGSKSVDLNEQLYKVNLEQLLKLCTKVEFKKEGEHQNSYLLALPGSEYDEVKIIFNKKTFFIEKMVLYYNEKQNPEEKEGGVKEAPRLEITYIDLNVNPAFSEKDFTYDKFIEKSNGKWRCTETYKAYNLNENLLN